MLPFTRRITAALLIFLPLIALTPAAAQSLRLDVFNIGRAITGRTWAAGNWGAFVVDEETKDLNGDGDTDDAIACVVDLRTNKVRETGLAVSYRLLENEEDWPVAIGGDRLAVQVSEADQGGKDRNGNGTATDDVLAVVDLNTGTVTNLGVVGQRPTWLGGRLYFVQPESMAGRDLNGDGDMADNVLCQWDPATGQITSLGMDATFGFKAAGDWIATATSETNQYNRDLNGDGDTADVVAQLYRISTGKWTNTGLECSFGIALTPQLLAVGVDEARQGKKDLNGNGTADDVVCEVWNLATGELFNTGQDCGGGIAADGAICGFVTREANQGKRDLNGDGDAEDEVAQVYQLGDAGVRNLRYDASGGIVAGAGKIAFACSEYNQKKDLNRDGDMDDFVLLTYDPTANRITNVGYAVDGELASGEGMVAWKVLEADQGNRDINRDGDTDDSIACVLDLATGSFGVTGWAASDSLAVCQRAAVFGCPEIDQGNKDLNGDGDTDDEVLVVARVVRH